MNLEPNNEQRLLAQSVESVLAHHYVPGFRAEAVESELGWSAQTFQALAELGVTGLTIAEADGGVGAGAAEVYVVLEQLGRKAAAEPLLDGVFLPAWLLCALGGARLSPSALAEGEHTFALAHAEPGRDWDLAPTTTASTQGESAAVSGVKSPVAHADHAQHYLVTAVDEHGEFALYAVDAAAAGIARVDGRTTDWTHASQLTFTDAPATLLATGAEARQAFAVSIAKARIAIAAEAVGVMESGLAQVVEYLRSRKQFGVTLSMFQALVHRAADLYAEIELARSTALWATAKVAEFDGGAQVDLSAIADDAFVFVAGVARGAAEEIIQLHGGIGMTYESDVSHLAARLTAITQSFGGIAAAQRRAVTAPSALSTPEATAA
ncbi:acyl-CoA dehydrogenase family protein [Nocardia callitridis]|uniref:Acyl-CoA dehydrogenase family protein n=1 Tax=Nocardia callitridis TaxID=648753 RepID=A0ABP9K6U5_9NOCA